MKYFVVTDPHGYCTKLKAALDANGFSAEREDHKLIVLGDLMDRGHESDEMQKFILALLRFDKVILIRGNHEDLIEDLVTNIYHYLQIGLLNTHHHINGTLETAMRLSGMNDEEIYISPRKFITRMENTVLFRRILPYMRDYFETESSVFVHGWIPCFADKPGSKDCNYTYDPNWRSADARAWEKARWYNGMACAAQGVRESGKTVYCGHYPCSWGHSVLSGCGTQYGSERIVTPFVSDGIVALDARTAVTGVLNCVVIEE